MPAINPSMDICICNFNFPLTDNFIFVAYCFTNLLHADKIHLL
jgi:hypothetical protein